MWVIVITLALPLGEPEVSEVHGFRSEAVCVVAGKEWRDSLPTVYWPLSSFVCVRAA